MTQKEKIQEIKRIVAKYNMDKLDVSKYKCIKGYLGRGEVVEKVKSINSEYITTSVTYFINGERKEVHKILYFYDEPNNEDTINFIYNSLLKYEEKQLTDKQ